MVLQRTSFAVPVFHGYGHNMACQVSYGMSFVHMHNYDAF